MKKSSLATIAGFLALGVGLVYVSVQPPKDAPTLMPADPIVTVAPKPKPKPEPKVVKWVPSHTATISIPAIGVRENVSMELNAGPAFWPITGRPGDGDTVAIAGHRTTYTAPFYALDKLSPGNMIYIKYQDKTYAYEVTKIVVEPATNLHIADAVGYERLLLTACARADGSPTSLDYRIVVLAKPIF